jgi:2-phospho-L-lactate guanylyltransferase
MPGTLAILPIKSFADAKQRLSTAFDNVTRSILVEAMFTDVLRALSRCETLDAIIVVTGDNVAHRIAEGYGARVVVDDQRGHNQAVTLGVRQALELEAERVLLVPGDCPLLDPAEVDELVSGSMQSGSVVIVPDRHGTGTNALLITPPDAFHPAFGHGSRQRHEERAAAAGLSTRTVTVFTLALDVDTPEDLEAMRAALTERRGGAAHTRGMLAQMARTGAQ